MARKSYEEKQLEALVLFDQTPDYLHAGFRKQDIEDGTEDTLDVILIVLHAAMVVLNHRSRPNLPKKQ
jgi:hypothetical protein